MTPAKALEQRVDQAYAHALAVTSALLQALLEDKRPPGDTSEA